MFNGNNYSLADIAAATGGNDRNNNGFMDGGWAWWIIILLIFGWGNGNWGFGGNGGGGANAPAFQGWATRADIQESFATNNLQSGITAIQQGICDATYALNNGMTNGFHNQTVATMQGFNGVQTGQNAIQAQLASCCCDLQTAIQGVNYNMATNTCDIKTQLANSTRDIVDASNNNTRAILDFLTQDKISSLQTELAQAQGQLSQANQTNSIINALKPCPSPAYVVPNPYAYANPCGCGC